eukprot:TRINITY_DN1884_c0_g1_i1.p1 TRINITY_DN1884_c0_g1~~TRINITY_DN1884_c0_g1_i1.p1  ORF type:complete len:307 (-),score=64.65 TRINITY_DN1884_c0_g1_i1:31-951(-)
MANPLILPRTLVFLCSIGALVLSAISIAGSWWKITATITYSDYSGLDAGQKAYVSFGLTSYSYYSNLNVNASTVIQGSESYSDLNPEPTNITEIASSILSMLAIEICLSAIFVIVIGLAFTKHRALFRRRWLQYLLVAFSLICLASAIISLGLINKFPSAVQDDYGLLFSPSTAKYLPSFDCSSDFTIAGLQFDGKIPSCTTVWATTGFALTSDSVNVQLALSLNTGTGWWLNIGAAFCAAGICLFFIPGKSDLFLDNVPTRGGDESEIKKNELQQLKESERSREQGVEDEEEHEIQLHSEPRSEA